MIRNKKQAAVARKKQAQLLDAIRKTPKGQDSSFLEILRDLEHELREYEAIEDGRANVFAFDSIDDLGDAVVKARLARGWSQRQLAGVLGVSEQMIQKDESRSYERAGIARIADIVDALGYELTGLLVPTYLPLSTWRILPTASQVGVTQAFVAAGPTLAAASSTTILAGVVQRGLHQPMLTQYGTVAPVPLSNNFAVVNVNYATGPAGIAGGELWAGSSGLRSLASAPLGTLSTGTLITKAECDS